MRVATLRPTICAAPAETDCHCQRTAQVENLVGAGGIRYNLGFQLYWRSLGKRASFALKFGFIAEKFAQAYGARPHKGTGRNFVFDTVTRMLEF